MPSEELDRRRRRSELADVRAERDDPWGDLRARAQPLEDAVARLAQLG